MYYSILYKYRDLIVPQLKKIYHGAKEMNQQLKKRTVFPAPTSRGSYCL